MKKQLTLLLIVSISHLLFSQNIEKEILEYTEPKTTLINKGRSFILDHLESGDYDKAAQAYVFLNDSLRNSNYRIFSFQEQIFLAVITQHYNYALEEVLNKKQSGFSSIFIVDFPIDYNYNTRAIENLLASIIATNFSGILSNIESSELTFEEKSVVLLALKKSFLYASTPIYTIQEINQENLNLESTQFLNEFPNSIYANYVRNFVRYEIVYERGLGFDFGLGTSLLTGTLSENFQPSVNFTFGFEGMLKKHTLYLRASLINAKNHLEITNTPFLLPIPEKTPIRFAVGELSYGYNILNGKKMNITPFAGIGIFEQSFGEKFTKSNPDYEDFHKDHFTYTAGVNFDLNVFKNIDSEEAKLPLRVRISYVKPVVNNYTYLQGSMLNLTVGFALKYWEPKRIY